MDIGVAREVSGERIIRRKIAYGTKNMTKGPAMTKEEAVRALEVGIELAQSLKQQGYRIPCDRGDGNRQHNHQQCCGLGPAWFAPGKGCRSWRGPFISRFGAQTRGHSPRHREEFTDPIDALDVLQKVGGLDLAGWPERFWGQPRCECPC